MRQEITGWKKWYNEEFHNLYSSLIIRVLKYRVKSAGHATYVGR
jgi:hypothetical protein